jgi:hypothetical protein
MMTTKTIKTKECTVNGKKCYGITDGRGKWFFYAYKTKEQADGMLKHFDTKMRVEVNISQPQPFKLVEEE